MSTFEIVLAGLLALVLAVQAVLLLGQRRAREDRATADALALITLSLGGVREAVAGNFEQLGRTLRDATEDTRAMQLERLGALHAALGEQRTGTLAESKALREELLGNFGALSDAVVARVTEHGAHHARTLGGFGETLEAHRRHATDSATALRTETGEAIRAAIDTIRMLGASNEQRQEKLREAVEQRLETLRRDNAEKLDQMRVTVDEKLQGTLNERLGASFAQVNENLERVFKSVGEMQALATGVGDLKRVLTNVKLRGTWGEGSLGALLEQVLTPEQFGANVEIKPGSNRRVEYAVRLPGSDAAPVWLPIDSKMPHEDYERLMRASESGDPEGVDAASRDLERAILVCGRDICAKYVEPPHSTDFGVMFLPSEGLFAEVVRRPGLVDRLQSECRVIVTGPTTLMALLNSLRMGFRTLAIQQRSGEVWQVLAAVKTEFGKFGPVLEKVSKKLGEAQNVIEDANKRRRAMDRQLRGVESLADPGAAEVRFEALLEEMIDEPEPAP